MADASDEARELARVAADRLHHLSMRYIGALIELGQGRPIGMVPMAWPGRREGRDLCDLIMLCRAEINALTAVLHKKGQIDIEQFTRQCAEEYEYLAQTKAKFLGCKVTDDGLEFQVGRG